MSKERSQSNPIRKTETSGELPKEDGTPEQQIIPKEDRPIDKFFWFNLSRKWVGNGLQNLVDICERLKTAIAWFFGLGTSGVFISLFLGNNALAGVDVSHLTIPLLCFLFSYGLAVMGQTVSLHKNFEPNSAETIKDTYNNVMKKSRFYILGSAFLLMVGLVSFPLIVSYSAKPQSSQNENEKTDISFNGAYMIADTTVGKKKHNFITQVSMQGKCNENVNAIQIRVDKGKGLIYREQVFSTAILPDSSTGHFFLTVPFEIGALPPLDPKDNVFLSCEYQDIDGPLLKRTTIKISEME